MLRISPSLGMLGIEEDTRRLAEDILSVLVTRPGRGQPQTLAIHRPVPGG